MASDVSILVADDDPDDRFLIKEALDEAHLENHVDFVEDGVDLMDYLRRQGDYTHLQGNFLPGLLLLDLNMPKKDGREALKEIKEDPDLRRIPVIVLTTSRSEEDIFKAYDLGVNSFISKPVTFAKLVEAVKSLTNYWLEVVKLPTE